MFRADENRVPMPYASHDVMRGTQGTMISDFESVFAQAVQEMIEDGKDVLAEVGEEFKQLETDLVDATPFHEDGPTDPPFHAAEVWKMRFEANDKDGFTMTIYNPKDYMSFLEAGWSPQAPAGWIAALWADFMMRVQG